MFSAFDAAMDQRGAAAAGSGGSSGAASPLAPRYEHQIFAEQAGRAFAGLSPRSAAKRHLMPVLAQACCRAGVLRPHASQPAGFFSVFSTVKLSRRSSSIVFQAWQRPHR